MSVEDRWLLPEGIEELLPREAEQLEALRRSLLDLYHTWGYELVMPPLIEFLESLLTGAGHDLDLQTFKLTDQLSGRLMGVRADMTPQVARIDAHQLRRESPVRLCYLGPVLRTRPDTSSISRSPLQVGVELYGHAGVESDLEALSLMLETLRSCGVGTPFLDLGHVGIFRALATQAGLEEGEEAELFDALQRKARPEVEAFLSARPGMDDKVTAMLAGLADLNGGEEVITQAREQLKAAGPSVHEALSYLDEVATGLHTLYPDVDLHIDLAELRGYKYQTGVVFAAFVPGYGQELARGGRYDDIGRVFGRARAATGFSADLMTLAAVSGAFDEPAELGGVFAPAGNDQDLLVAIRELRAQGRRVVQQLPGQEGDGRALGCDRELVKRDGHWEVVPLPTGGESDNGG